jgi:hypothetical protein
MSWGRRLITIAVGYIAASIVAGVILGFALVYSPDSPWGPLDLNLARITALFVSLVSGFVALLALIPTLVVGIYAERAAVRSPLFYAVAGAGIGLCALGFYGLILILGESRPLSETLPADLAAIGLGVIIAVIAAIVALAGIAAGLTYWAIAGRNAGRLRALSLAS